MRGMGCGMSLGWGWMRTYKKEFVIPAYAGMTSVESLERPPIADIRLSQSLGLLA